MAQGRDQLSRRTAGDQSDDGLQCAQSRDTFNLLKLSPPSNESRR